MIRVESPRNTCSARPPAWCSPRVPSVVVMAAAASMLIAALAGKAHAQGMPLLPPDPTCEVYSAPDRLTPEDYRRPSKRLALVEAYHFTPAVESLLRPMQGSFGGDINYTLWGYPNHHRALATLVRLGIRERTDKPRGSQFTIDCYFRRALRFASDDHIVRMLYADYLGKVDRKDDARAHLAYVAAEAGDNPLTHRNLGLIYLELGAYDEALVQAHRAERLGMPPGPLRAALERAGRWRDDDAPAADAAAPAQPASGPAPAAS